MQLSPRAYTACNLVDLHHHYSTVDNPLLCGFCKETHKKGVLNAYVLADGKTHWYVCPKCGFAGTGTEYLAKLNKVEIVKQIQSLVKKEKIPPVALEDVQKFKSFREFWAELKDNFVRATPFRREASIAFANLYDLDYYPPAQSFRLGTKAEIEQWFLPSLKTKRYNTSASRLFHGQWKKIVAIPLYDMPLHLSGVLLVNGHEQANPEYVVKRLGPYTTGQYLFDPGFLGTRMVCRPDQTAVVLCSQWKLTLLLQSTAYRQENKYAPLLGWFPNEKMTYNWNGLKDIPKIFWSQPTDLVNLREACLQYGMVSSLHFDKNGVFFSPDRLYGALIRSIVKSAEPWHKALTWYLENGVENITRLDLPPTVIEKYLEYAPASVRGRLTPKIFSANTGSVDGSRIVSNIDGWWKMEKNFTRSLLSNVRCSLEKVVHISDDQPIYQGKVFIGDKEYSFTEKEEVFEKYPIQTVKKVCVENECMQFLRINVKNDQYLRMVQEHSAPETIYRENGYGWSKKEKALLLPNITIADAALIATQLSLQTGPFYKLTDREVRPSSYRELLANFQEEAPIIFSIFAAIIPQLFSPAYGMLPPQTVISGGEFALVKQIGDMLGIPHVQLKDKEEIERYVLLHQCPFLVRISPTVRKKKVSHEWADILGLNTPGIVWSPVTEAVARMSYGTANLLLLPNSRMYRWFDGKLPGIFQDCFIACLQHVSKYVLDPTTHTDDWNNDLLKEVHQFFEDETGVAPAKNSLFGGYYEQVNYFYDYVNLLYRSEMLAIENEKISVMELASCYRKHVGIFDFQNLYDELQKSQSIGEHDAKKQMLSLNAECLAESRRRLEKFYGTLLRG